LPPLLFLWKKRAAALAFDSGIGCERVANGFGNRMRAGLGKGTSLLVPLAPQTRCRLYRALKNSPLDRLILYEDGAPGLDFETWDSPNLFLLLGGAAPGLPARPLLACWGGVVHRCDNWLAFDAG